MNDQPSDSAAGGAATDSDGLRARQKAFLEGYVISGNVTKAAELAGVHRATHYRWLEEDQDYKEAFVRAEDQFADRIRDFVRRRAIDGVPEPIVWQGVIIRDRDTEEVVTILKRSDRILEMLAKAKCPEFRDKQETTHTGEVKIKVEYGN